MSWPDRDTEYFPDPREGEPARLRQDILDELADHLALAAERERASGTGEDEVWGRVVDRFGDPDALARQLWWNAMKEVIMREWIRTGAIVLLVLSMVAFMGLVLVQTQRANRELLTALRDRSDAAAGTVTALDVFLHRATPDGPPAEGIEATFSGKLFGSQDEVSVTDVTGPDGHLHYGPLEQGEYRLTLRDLASGLEHVRSVVLWAGHGEDELHLAAPDVGSAEVELDGGLPAYEDGTVSFYARLASNWSCGDVQWSRLHDLLLKKDGIRDVSRAAPPDNPGKGVESPPYMLVEEGDARPRLEVACVPLRMVTLALPTQSMGRPKVIDTNRYNTYPPGEPGAPTFEIKPGEENRIVLPLTEDQQAARNAGARFRWNVRAIGNDWYHSASILSFSSDQLVTEAYPVAGMRVRVTGPGNDTSRFLTSTQDWCPLSSLRGDDTGPDAVLLEMPRIEGTADDASRAVLLLGLWPKNLESSDNALLACAVRSPWPPDGEASPEVDAEPFARVIPAADQGELVLDLPPLDRLADMTAVLLRWERQTEDPEQENVIRVYGPPVPEGLEGPFLYPQAIAEEPQPGAPTRPSPRTTRPGPGRRDRPIVVLLTDPGNVAAPPV